MGKAKKKRQSGAARMDPMGGMGENGENGETEHIRSEEEIISNIMDQLQSVNPEDKVCGCHSLGNLTSLNIIKKILIKEKMVRVVGPLLLEQDDIVRLAAVGSLRNISATDPDTAEEMVNQDVMTPLEMFLSNYQSSPADSLKEADLNILTEAVNLLWNLVEASPTAFNLFTSSTLFDFTLSLLAVESNVYLVVGVLSLLSAACDQNSAASKKVLAYQSRIEALLSHPTSLKLRINSALLLATILEDSIFESPVFPSLVQTLDSTLRTDVRKQICEWSSSAPVTEDMEMEVEGGQDDQKLKECEDQLSSQQTALEILTNLCSLGEDGDNWENVESEEEDEADVGDEMEGEGVQNINAAPPPLIEAVVSLQIVQRVLEKANSLPHNVTEILQSSTKGKKILKEFDNLRIRTFLCLSNLTESLSIDDLGGASALFSTWNSLGTIVVQSKEEKLLEAASSCMRSATAKLCSDTEGHKVMNLTQNELEAIVQVGQTSEVAEVRMNMVNIVGDISIMLSRSLKETASVEIFRTLVLWLVEGGCKDTDLRVVAESLDKLFDAFSEDHTDSVFFPLNLLPKLRGIHTALKIKIAQQKRELSQDSLGIINMARVNLHRFIKYKEKRVKT